MQAGAGSGKTTTLVNRLARILEEPEARLSSVVAITFTEKAAEELKERLRALCDERLTEAQDAETRSRWRGHRQEIDSAHIGTIHGFCARLLRAHALRLGLDPRLTVLDDAQATLQLQETLREHVLAGVRDRCEYLSALVGAFGVGALVECLGAALRERGKPLLEGLPTTAEGVLARWDEALAEQREEGLARLSRDSAVLDVAATLRDIEPRDPKDKLAELRAQALVALGAALNEEAPTTDRLAAWGQLGALRAGRAGRKGSWPEGRVPEVREAMGALRTAAEAVGHLAPADEEVEASAAALTAQFCVALPGAMEAYSEAKRVAAVVDFDDLLVLARDLLRDHPDIRATEQRRFEHILVDEFQDTDPIQREAIWYLAEDGATAGCLAEVKLKPGKLFLVGDAKQSIYRFRGADVTVYDGTRGEFEADPDAAVVPLTANFRSQLRLVAFFNELFAHDAVMGPDSPRRHPFEAAYEPLTATRPPAAGEPDVTFVLAFPPTGDGARGGVAERRERAGDRVAELLAQGVGEGALTVADDDESQRLATWRDIMVLLPTMTAIHVYEQALRRHGIPYYVVAGKGFYQRPEIIDAIAVLRTLEDPRDQVALARVLRSPMFCVSDEGLYWLAGASGLRAGVEGLLTAESADARMSDDDLSRARRAAETLTNLRSVRDRVPLSELVQRVLDETSLPEVSAARFDGPRAYANLAKLVDVARQYEATDGGSLSGFVAYVQTLRTEEIREGEAPAEEEHGDAVTVMTIHRSKGLQRPIVVAVDLAREGGGGGHPPVLLHPEAGPVAKGEKLDGALALPPIGEAARLDAEAREVAERRRLLYVALTRARDRLIISTPVGRRRDGSLTGGAHVEALFGAFGEQLETEGRIVGNGWSGEVVHADEASDARRDSRQALWTTHAEEVAAGAELPGGDETVEAAVHRQLAPVSADLARKSRFTVTELAAYLHCPKMYELRYVRQYAPYSPGTETVAEGKLRPTERGIIVHRALQRLGRGPLEGLRGQVEAAARESGLAGHDEAEIGGIVSLLEGFRESDTWRMIEAAEELRSEARVIGRLGAEILEGQVDALMWDTGGKAHLLDYKTGRADEGPKQADHVFQVGAYAALLARAGRGLPETVAVHYLHGGERLDVDPEAGAADSEARAEQAMDGIQRSVFPQTPQCDGEQCPYAWVCKERGV